MPFRTKSRPGTIRIELGPTQWKNSLRTSLGLMGILAASGQVMAQQAAPDTATAAAPLVFEGVTVVDVAQGKLVPNQRVVVTGNRIAAAGAASEVKAPKGGQVVDARGKYLIPGLWDMHVHPGWNEGQYTDLFNAIFIANGVTGIRDAWSDVPLDTQRRWRQEILAGTRVGPPRQILSGVAIDEDPTCQREGLTGHVCVSAGDTADARRLVEQIRAAGADMVKTYTLGQVSYFAIAAAARRVGIPFGGHISDVDERNPEVVAALQQQFFPGLSRTMPGVSAAQASDSGASIIDHVGAGGLDTLCIGTEGTVERCQALAERFRRNGTWWVPTLSHGSRTLGTFDSTFWAGAAHRNDWSSALVHLAQTASPNFPMPPPHPQDSTTADRGDLRLAHRVGLPILAGTDAGVFANLAKYPARFGFGLHVELTLYVAAGLTPLEALQSATLNPAKMLHGTDSLGTVAPGKLADLVLLDADPLADITNVATIAAVVANGRYFDRAALDQLAAHAQEAFKARDSGHARSP